MFGNCAICVKSLLAAALLGVLHLYSPSQLGPGFCKDSGSFCCGGVLSKSCYFQYFTQPRCLATVYYTVFCPHSNGGFTPGRESTPFIASTSTPGPRAGDGRLVGLGNWWERIRQFLFWVPHNLFLIITFLTLFS